MDQAELDSALRHLAERARPFARDTTLAPALLDLYTVGRVLREPTFCDTSHHVAGLVAPHRYLIISAEFFALDEEDLPQRGLCVLRRDSYLKVLDHTRDGDRVQIALLHIPDALLEFFNRPGLNPLEERFAGLARQCFADCLNQEPVPELDTDGWRDRLVYPIGIDDDGVPYELSCEQKPLPASAAAEAGNRDDDPAPMIAAGDVLTTESSVRVGDIVRLERVAADQVVMRVCGPDDPDDGKGPYFRAVKGEKPGSFALESLT